MTGARPIPSAAVPAPTASPAAPGLPIGPPPVVEFAGVSKWYGHVIGLNNLTIRVAPGVTGLLGPNGAGKSTFLQLATGQLRPSQGRVTVLGHRPWNNPGLNRYIGLCPEQDAFYEWMTGREFVSACARLGGLPRRRAAEAAAGVLEVVGLTGAADRPVRGYSKGMRQRAKLAQSLVHDPTILFLDEPLTGTDPVARRDLIDIIVRLAADGRSVIISSHVLHEVQAITPRIVLLNRGRLLAEGDTRQIRDLIDTHPHRIVLKGPDVRALAARLVAALDIDGVEFRRSDGALIVETRSPDPFYASLPALAADAGTAIDEVYSDDDNLEAVFNYLVNG